MEPNIFEEHTVLDLHQMVDRHLIVTLKATLQEIEDSLAALGSGDA